CFAETVAISPLPLVSGVAPLDAYFAESGVQRVGLRGTGVVMRTRLYGQLVRTRSVVLDDEVDILDRTYLDVAVAGVCMDDQRALFFDAGRRMIEDHGADAIVLAGTDLGLAFDGHDPGYKVIDALDIHVDLLARLAVGRVSLEDAGASG
ncbi:MAG: aspartate/glutamate racemase family protein, partial [Pseudomonadota bacterium]